ncbi:MAG: hypothetical protein WCI94_17160, partial [Rhodospirillales bacterium]
FTLFAVSVLLSLLSIAPTYAIVVTGTYAGTVTGATGDFNGLFGTTGAAAGNAITGTFRYDTAFFNAPSATCTGGCAAWGSTDGSMAGGVLIMTQTINGVTLSWNGVYYNGVTLGYSTSGGPWPYNYLHQAFELVSEETTPLGNGTNTVQINLGTLDNTVSIVNPSLDPAGPFNLQAAQFGVNASSWNTSTSLVQWDFQIGTIDAPEPDSVALLAMGAILLHTARRRAGRPDADGQSGMSAG